MTDSFGKYSLVSRLGNGGMAEVFSGRLSGIGGFEKRVVVKRLLPSLVEDEAFVQMFMDEARLAANLNHPNIAQVFEIDVVDDIPYIAMEYVEGPTLQSLIRAARTAKRRDYRQFAFIMAAVCDALAYAHSAKDVEGQPLSLVHRDVTPHNVLVSSDGIPKLVDFGIAKAAGRLQQTSAGTIKGKLKYMSPEQLINADQLDGRADVFSAGVCIFAATTFQFPFQQATEGDLGLIQAILKTPYAKPTDFVPDYPPALDRIVNWAIDPDRNKRCPSAQVLRDELEQYIDAQPEAMNARALAQWMIELGPLMQAKGGTNLTPSGNSDGRGTKTPGSGPRKNTGSQSLRPGMKKSTPQPEVEVELIEPKGSGLKYAVMGLGAVVVLGVGALFAKGTFSPPPPVSPPLVQNPNAPVVNDADDKGVNAILDEVEKLVAAKRYAPALSLLEKARTYNPRESKVVIRLVRVSEATEREAVINQATRQIESQKYKAAIETVKQLLDRDPNDPEGRRLLTLAREGMAPEAEPVAAAPVAKPDPKDRVKKPTPVVNNNKDGTLTLVSTPAAAVYVDDDLIGTSPIKGYALRPGKHQVQVRVSGYQPKVFNVDVAPGKDSPITANLVQETKRSKVTYTEEDSQGDSANAPPTAVPSVTPTTTVDTSKLRSYPESTIPIPHLPVKYTPKGPSDLARVLGIIEDQAVNEAGLHPALIRGVTKKLEPKGEIYPSGIYYFLIREASLKHDQATAAENLIKVHQTGLIARFKDLPSHDTPLP